MKLTPKEREVFEDFIADGHDYIVTRSYVTDLADRILRNPEGTWYAQKLHKMLDVNITGAPRSVKDAAFIALSFGISHLIEFLQSPEHLAVKATVSRVQRELNLNRREARRKIRSWWGGLGWRREIRNSVKEATKQQRRES